MFTNKTTQIKLARTLDGLNAVTLQQALEQLNSAIQEVQKFRFDITEYKSEWRLETEAIFYPRPIYTCILGINDELLNEPLDNVEPGIKEIGEHHCVLDFKADSQSISCIGFVIVQ